MDFSYQTDNSGNSETKTDNGTSHTASLIKAASPYFDSDSQRTMHFFAAVYEVMDSIQLFSQKKTVSALSFSIKNVDIEGMLKGIRPVCNTQERSLVDKFLNIFNMRRMFETYQMMSSMMSMFNQDSSNADQTMNNEFNQSMNAPPFSEEDNYKNDFTSHQDNFDYEDDFNYENKPTPIYYEQVPDYLEAAQMKEPELPMDHQTHSLNHINPLENHQRNQESDFTKENQGQTVMHNQQQFQQQIYSQSSQNHSKNDEVFQQQSQDEKSNESSSTMNNQQMMDMLSGMLTPEQKNTFESMKMLFDSGLFHT